MNKLSCISALLILCLSLSGQDLMKGIKFNMPKNEAKEIIRINKEDLKITIGSVEFTAPTIEAKNGLTKAINFSEKLRLFESSDEGNTLIKINDLKNFFTNRDYSVDYETSALRSGDTILGAEKGCAAILSKDQIYVGILYIVVAADEEQGTKTTFTLYLSMTSKDLDEELFKKYFTIAKPSNSAEDVF